MSINWTRGFEASVSSPSNCWTRIAGSLVGMKAHRQFSFVNHFELRLHYCLVISCNSVFDYMHLDLQQAFENFIAVQSSVVVR